MPAEIIIGFMRLHTHTIYIYGQVYDPPVQWL